MDTLCALCGEPAHSGAPLALCLGHFLEAHDWVDGDLGVTDVLPSPCAFCGSRFGVRYPSGWLCAVCEGGAALPHDEVLAFERGDRTLEHPRHEQFTHRRIPGTEWPCRRTWASWGQSSPVTKETHAYSSRVDPGHDRAQTPEPSHTAGH